MTNIAKLLKDAPKGMKLYSPLFGEVEYMQLGDENKIWVKTSCGTYYFDKNGKPYAFDKSECLLFPSKDCRTWEGWKLPSEPKFKVGDWIVQNDNGTVSQITKVINGTDEHGEYRAYEHTNGYFAECFDNEYHLWSIADAKDGDILAADNGWTCIFQAFDGYVFSSYCFMDSQKWFCEFGSEAHTLDSRINGNIHPATKEQCNQFFTKMKEAGYTWDSEKKELKKIQPHYDIANFKPFDKVLVRDNDRGKWRPSIFSYHIKGRQTCYPFCCIGNSFSQCIPFEGNEALLGTTDIPNEEYINW